MLQRATVEDSTLELLARLSQGTIPESYEFALAGGTALALQIGHRKSIDLDFFTLREFDTDAIEEALQGFEALTIVEKNKNSLTVILNGVKTDFIRHNYPLIVPLKKNEGIALYAVPDIAAMKLNAIINRGSRKDFFDLFFLLELFSAVELAGFFKRKYGNRSEMMLYKSLFYFQDAEQEPDPVLIKKATWEEVKRTIVRSFKSII